MAEGGGDAMSKGLGRLQTTILDYIQSRGKAVWFIDIAYSVTYKLKGEEVPPTYAEYESSVRWVIRYITMRQDTS